MIKGVTKKIIEINNPDSIYFEKAVFYLRPNVRELPPEISRAEAHRYISKLGLEYMNQRKKRKWGRLFFAAAVMLSTAAVAFVFLH